MRYQPQKLPARKKRRCHKHGRPYRKHVEHFRAEKEQGVLEERFRKKFAIFVCEFCGCFHVCPKGDVEEHYAE